MDLQTIMLYYVKLNSTLDEATVLPLSNRNQRYERVLCNTFLFFSKRAARYDERNCRYSGSLP